MGKIPTLMQGPEIRWNSETILQVCAWRKNATMF